MSSSRTRLGVGGVRGVGMPRRLEKECSEGRVMFDQLPLKHNTLVLTEARFGRVVKWERSSKKDRQRAISKMAIRASSLVPSLLGQGAYW
eukprot:3271116-Rhodomonas_salina.2